MNLAVLLVCCDKQASELQNFIVYYTDGPRRFSAHHALQNCPAYVANPFLSVKKHTFISVQPHLLIHHFLMKTN